MKKWNVDIFALNNLEYNYIEIGNSKSRVVIIEDLFNYPDLVRQHALECQYFPLVGTINPGIVSYLTLGLPDYIQLLTNIKYNCFDEFSPYTSEATAKMTFQAYRTNNDNTPHYDFVQYASVTSLNTNEENNGTSGTSFYRHQNGHEYAATGKYRTLLVENGSSDPAIWERYHIEPHAYNKMIMYEGYLYHNVYWEEDKWTSETPRLTFNSFVSEHTQ